MQGQANSIPKPGVPNLHRYPFLVYAPAQHGDFVATEDKGIDVRQLAAEVAAGASKDAVATAHGTTPQHVTDAVRYCEDHPA